VANVYSLINNNNHNIKLTQRRLVSLTANYSRGIFGTGRVSGIAEESVRRGAVGQLSTFDPFC